MNIENIFRQLYESSTEDEVDAVLEKIHDKPDFGWHPYGDNESYFGVIENQQASAIPALVEKITNSIDAIMMRRCLEEGIDPRSPEAPQNVEEAVSKFFPKSEHWDLPGNRQRQAEDIQILADGPRNNTSLIIYDNGEGQNPEQFKNTFLSLLRGNKNEIHFVQGKYNMGGSGAIVFCGKQRYQLMASRRFDKSGNFGFTIIRKHPLSQKEKETKKNTWYEYLTINGEVPSFPISDDGLDLGLYKRKFTTGTVIKLFSYNLPSGSRSVISRDLNQSINEYLFQPALPVYTIDNNERYPKDRNPERDLFGLKYRLKSDDNKYISESFSEEIKDSTIGSCKLTVYVFKHKIGDKNVRESKDSIRREFFKNNMSVVFSLNGQVHGHYTAEFISRSLKFSLLKDYLLIHVDCTNLEPDFRGELFMASRDRLKNGNESAILRKKLASLLSKKGGRLSDVYNKRKEELSANAGSSSDLLRDFSENLPFDSELMKLIQHNFDLKRKDGEKPKKKKNSKPSNSTGKDEQPFSPNRFPTSFNIDVKNKNGGTPVIQIPIDGEKTIKFSTDVEDQYFDRTDEPGELQIAILKPQSNETDGGNATGEPKDIDTLLDVSKSSPNEGTIRVNINPTDAINVGDQITVRATLKSPSENLEQIFIVKILDKQKKQEKKPIEIEEPSQLGLPELIEVYQEKHEGKTMWADVGHVDFDYDKVMCPLIDNDKLEKIYINMDSTVFLNHKSKLKNANENQITVLRNRYLSSVYFHSLFLYMVNKNEGIEILKKNGQDNSDSIELSDYLMEIFDSPYSEFLLNFEVAALMENLND